MNPCKTIAEAAEKALNAIGRAASVEDIYANIIQSGLYQFNTPTPLHVLETELKRYSQDSPRSDRREKYRFKMNPDKTYIMAKEDSTAFKKSTNVGMKRIMRSADKEDIIEELMSSRVGVFSQIWKLLLFAAQVGIKTKRREPLKAIESGKGIDQATFGNSSAWPGILYLMGLAEEGDSRIIECNPDGEDQRIQMFQEYANGGLAVIKEFFKNRPIDLDGILAFIEANQSGHNSLNEPDLDLSI